jgi:hypothetical protein
MEEITEILVGKPEGKRSLEIIGRRLEDNIRMDFEEMGSCGLGLSDSGREPVAGCCEYGNEPLDSIKGRKFLDYLSLSDYWLLRKESAPWSQSVRH